MRFAVLVAVAMVVSCASDPYVEDMMPGPAYYRPADATSYREFLPPDRPAIVRVLYATDRQPAGPDDSEPHYLNERGHCLRLGAAEVTIGDGGMTWGQAIRLSLDRDREESLPLRVTAAEEFGPLVRSISPIARPAQAPEEMGAGEARFAEEINERLRRTRLKDVFVYVHGYRVVFENPVMVAAELWHFLGHSGVFVAYSWPSTPSALAYFKDLETGKVTSRNLRMFLQYLAERTEARRIHLLGYSMGTRVVAGAVGQLALMNADRPLEDMKRRLRIGQVILTASDMDRAVLGGYLLDGGTRVPDHVTIYQSDTDQALSLSQWIFARSRAGEPLDLDELDPRVAEYLWGSEELSLVNVTGVERAESGSGHGYFRASPWVSSDVLATLAFGLSPAERGLVREEGDPVWTFPDDYIPRLRLAVERAKAGLE